MEGSQVVDNDIVISGLSIALPGIDSLEQFSNTLFEGLSLRPKLQENIPKGYHDEFPSPGGRLEHSYELDDIFFGLNRATFLTTSRLQLKFVEACYIALVDAGLKKDDIHDFICQVYGSASRNDGEYATHSKVPSRYYILASCRTICPNRVSFFLDQTGSSVFLDNSTCGGMQSLELAWTDIKEGRADMAIVCSGNIFPGENTTATMNDYGWLTSNGKVRSFDNEADGFQRNEGVVALVLQRAKHAKRIYAKINHVSCVTIPNPTSSLMKPAKESWVNFLDSVYSKSGISKDQIQYLEAYGAAIKDWDADELNAIMDVFFGERKDPLIVGSVKSNVGHTEGAAELVSIVKAIICLENGKITPNMHYNTPNSAIPGLVSGQLKVAENGVALTPGALIGINSFSHGGTYGHCILEGFNKPKVTTADQIPRLVLFSGRTEELMPEIINQVEDNVPFDPDYISLVHEIFKCNISQHLARGYTILPKQGKSLSFHEAVDAGGRPLWFVFSGMGSQWPGMGRDLMKLPLARNSIQQCHDILFGTGLDLINILTTDDKDIFKDNLNAFVGIGAIQIALVDIMNALKIVPDGIIGHSLGELAVSYMDKGLTLEETILSAYYRGKAVKDATLVKGAMAAVGKGYDQIKDSLPANVEVACHNSSSSSTISGMKEDVLKYVAELKDQSVFAKVVEVGEIGFHSQFIAPAGPFLLKYMKNVIKSPKARSTKWISTSVPEANWNEEAAKYSSPEYFTNNLLSSVLFEEGCAHVPENAILVEIAPHGLLQAILKRSFPKGINIPLTKAAAPDNLIFLLQAIGKLYTIGLNPDIAALYPAPNFPVARKTNSLHKLFPWCLNRIHETHSDVFMKRAIDLRKLVRNYDPVKGEHIFWEKKIAPVSYYPYLLWYSCYQSYPALLQDSFSLTDLTFFNQHNLSISLDIWVEGVTTLEGSNLTEITKEGVLLASAITSPLATAIKTVSSTISEQPALLSLKTDEIYNVLERRGYIIAKSMRHLISVDWTDKGLRGKIKSTKDWLKKFEAMTHLTYLNFSHKEDGLIVLNKIGRMEVSTNVDVGDIDLDIAYDVATNEISCAGLYVTDVTYKIKESPSKRRLQSLLPSNCDALKVMHIEGESMDCGEGLSWAVPATWNIENKDDVVAAYAMAYYCLVVIGCVRPYDRVLVTDGGSILGQAVISVALTLTDHVHATVANIEEANQLKTIFPKLNEENVHLHSDSNFLVKLKDRTLDKFPNIIFNALEGRIAHDLLICPPRFSQIFYLGNQDIEDNSTLLLRPFNFYLSLIAARMDNIKNWHIEEKQKVQQLVENGLLDGTVRPLKSLTSSSVDIKAQQLEAKSKNQNFDVKLDGSYLVVGDSSCVDLDIVEWLAKRGAKNILIYNPSTINRSGYKSMLNVIGLQRNTCIRTLDEMSLRKLTKSWGEPSNRLDAVFYVHVTDQELQSEFIEVLPSIKSEQFVTISRSRQNALYLQMHLSPNCKCRNIIWEDDNDQMRGNVDTLANLIAKQTFVNTTDNLTVNEQNFDSSKSDSITNTIEANDNVNVKRSNKLKLIELPTSGQFLKNSTPECQPVFIIPGIEDENLEAIEILAQGLMYPTFAVSIPMTEEISIVDLASAIAAEIIQLVDRKVYNLVGLSEGCVLAMEVARQMEKRNKIVALLLVDSHSSQKNYKLHHNTSTVDFNENCDLNLVRHTDAYINAVNNNKADDLTLNGPLTIMSRKSDKENLPNYNEICHNNYIVDTQLSHKNLMGSKELQNMINKFVVLDDVSSKTVHEPLWITFDKILEEYSFLVRQ